MFDMIKRYYNKNLYSIEDMKTFVVAKMITAEEFKVITNQNYN